MSSGFVARVARLRVPLGFVVAVVLWFLALPTTWTILVGTAISFVGEALRIWASGHLVKSREVTSSGPYRWFAHPLYVGSSIMGAGLAVGCNSVPCAVLIATYMGATIAAAIKSEEAFLRRTFGEQYDTYRRGRRTRQGPAAVERRFTLERVWSNHEERAVGGLLCVLGFLVLKLLVLTGLRLANI